MALDGILFEGVTVRVRRPNDYNPTAAAALGPSVPNPSLNLTAIGLAVRQSCRRIPCVHSRLLTLLDDSAILLLLYRVLFQLLPMAQTASLLEDCPTTGLRSSAESCCSHLVSSRPLTLYVTVKPGTRRGENSSVV